MAAVLKTGSGSRWNPLCPFSGLWARGFRGPAAWASTNAPGNLASLPNPDPRATPRLGHVSEGQGHSLGLCQSPPPHLPEAGLRSNPLSQPWPQTYIQCPPGHAMQAKPPRPEESSCKK